MKRVLLTVGQSVSNASRQTAWAKQHTQPVKGFCPDAHWQDIACCARRLPLWDNEGANKIISPFFGSLKLQLFSGWGWGVEKGMQVCVRSLHHRGFLLSFWKVGSRSKVLPLC